MPEVRQRSAQEENVLFRLLRWVQFRIAFQLRLRIGLRRLFILELLFLFLMR